MYRLDNGSHRRRGGLRLQVNDRVHVGAEARTCWAAHARLSALSAVASADDSNLRQQPGEKLVDHAAVGVNHLQPVSELLPPIAVGGNDVLALGRTGFDSVAESRRAGGPRR